MRVSINNICIVHGYLLEGSGSNLWTRSVIEFLARSGHHVHLMAQENHPEIYPFISKAIHYELDGTARVFLDREIEYPGSVTLHKPRLGPLLPVYVHDRYEEFEQVVPMIDLDDDAIESYIEKNAVVLQRIVEEQSVGAIHTNHAVLMPVVAQRVRDRVGTPYSIMPHGSALEYAVRQDQRFLRFAESAFTDASRIFVIGNEIRGRVLDILSSVDGLAEKTVDLHLGVNTAQFEPVDRDSRRDAVAAIGDLLVSVDRGKQPAASAELIASLEIDPSFENLERVAKRTSAYALKSPDADAETRLEAVDWSGNRMILFVGRLIAAKGPQNVIASLPVVLRDVPNARMVVVGHGPLREPLEALTWGLANGEREFVMDLVAKGGAFEEEDHEGFDEIATWFKDLESRDELDAYFRDAADLLTIDHVVFTGYLTHRELSKLFPCFDVAVFPSLVREAGPLVFLEALASGIYPMGTYFGGMEASIDAVARRLSLEDVEAMKIDPDPDRVVSSIAEKLPRALEMGVRHRDTLRAIAVDEYDWRSVSATLVRTMGEMIEEGGYG